MGHSEVRRSKWKWEMSVFQIYVALYFTVFTPPILYFPSFWNDSIYKAYHTGNLLILCVFENRLCVLFCF